MPASAPTILATSMGFAGGGRGPYDWRPGPVFDLAFELAGAPDRPRLCYLGTATGDDPARVGGVYGAFAGSPVQVSHLSLFPMPTVPDVRAHLLAQDVVWVGGGSVANLLAVWRRARPRRGRSARRGRPGVVLAGVSAGSLCWHVGGTTDSFGPDLRPVTNGLGLIPYVQRRALRLGGTAPSAVPAAGRRRHPAGRARDRRRCRAALPRHRARRGGGRPPGRGRLPRRRAVRTATGG